MREVSERTGAGGDLNKPMLLSIQTGYAGTEGGNTECAVGSRGESRPGIPKTTRARREDELGTGSSIFR